LCSRIAKDAHPINNEVTAYLRSQGYIVFVPHEAHYNETVDGAHAPDKEIYEQDMSEIRRSDVCVVVGKIGADCGFEVGWFERNGTPTVWFQQPQWSPMFDRVHKVSTLEQLGQFLKSQFADKESAA
jgi:nucleoside 2-deoxyribosyltransferase